MPVCQYSEAGKKETMKCQQVKQSAIEMCYLNDTLHIDQEFTAVKLS